MPTTLQGYSYNDDGTAAPNLSVTVFDQVPAQIGTTTTNASGFWQFTGLTDGVTYDVKVNNNAGIVRWIKGGEAHQVYSLNLTSPVSFSALVTMTGGLAVTAGNVGIGNAVSTAAGLQL